MEPSSIEELLTALPMIEALLDARREIATPAWLVGGCVRDLLLGRVPVDVDIASARSEAFARRFAALSGGTLVLLDAERAIWRVAMRGQPDVDFCGFRATEIVGDLGGRDFTFNALAVRLPEPEHAGGLLDPYHGLDDLHAGVLRMVSPAAFRDDPARILRAFRFIAELNLTVEEATWSALRAGRRRLSSVAPERLLAEWWKLCGGPHAAPAITRMDEAGVLGVFLPELNVTKGVTQNRYHHLDVWEHSLLAMTLMVRILRAPEEAFQELLPYFTPLLTSSHRRARLVMLALIHDIGKPAARTSRAGAVHFYRHEEVGAELAARLARRLRMSNDDKHALVAVIRHHQRPLFLLQVMQRGPVSRRAMAKFFDDIGEHVLEVMALALADKGAARGEDADPEVEEHLRALYGQLLRYYQQVYLPAREEPLLTGADLIHTLGQPPGPHIGALLRRARALQLEGHLTSHDDALRWAKGQLASSEPSS